MSDEPLISCLMVALPIAARLERLKQSVDGYLKQTYLNRELVILLNGGSADAATAIKAHVAALARDDIRIIEPPGTLTLGQLRNISKASAHGAVICQWDDDDLYHPERLERQFQRLVECRGEAVCLERVMQFYVADRTLYCDNFHRTAEAGFPGSLMCWTKTPIVYPEEGENARLGEDMIVAMRLQERGGLHALKDMPHLYVYVSHDVNSWGAWHHRQVSGWHGVSKGLLLRQEAALREGLAPYDFGPGEVTVMGPNGPAFKLR